MRTTDGGTRVDLTDNGLGDRGRRTNEANRLCREGRRLRDLNKLEEAHGLFVQATALDPNDNSAIVHNDLGLVLASLGDLPGAISEFNKALSFQPDMTAATINLAETYKQEGRVDAAVSYLKKFLDDHPQAAERSSVEASLKTLNHLHQAVGDVHATDYLDCVAPKGVCCWPLKRMPMRIFIQPGLAVDGYRDSFRQMVLKGLREWIEAANHHLTWRMVDNPKQADITFSWTSSKDDFPHGTEQGIARLLCTHNRSINHVDIKICTVPVSEDSTKLLSDEEMQLTCLHEIGHALGINGHSPNNSDVMFFCVRAFPITRLSPRDKLTIAHLYETPHDEVGQVKKRGIGIGIPGLFQIKL